MTEETDDALVLSARRGNRAAVETLIDRHYDTLHRVAYRLCGDRSEAEDIAQEAAIRIARGLAGFEGRAVFSTWCHGVVLNAARDALRARKRRSATLVAAGAMAFSGVPMLAEPEPADPDDGLWEAVRALPDRQREAVTLVYVEGLSHRDAAKAIGCAEATVSWHLFAARQKLKAQLARSAR